MNHWHSASVLALTAICGFTASPDRSDQQAPAGEARRRVVSVTAVDRHGAPVTDLTAAEFSLQEGGKIRDILNAGRATGPMQIALLVDDNGTGVFRYGVGRFIERALPEGVKPSERISVSVKRGGVSLRAPTHIPGGP